jgi:hypothetical protein
MNITQEKDDIITTELADAAVAHWEPRITQPPARDAARDMLIWKRLNNIGHENPRGPLGAYIHIAQDLRRQLMEQLAKSPGMAQGQLFE